jgi:hypothetical protein
MFRENDAFAGFSVGNLDKAKAFYTQALGEG